jgi:hypothetical protein
MASITGKKMGLAIRGKIMAKHELCWWYFFNTPTETCTIGFGTTLPQQNGLLAVWINKTNEIWEYVYIYTMHILYYMCIYIWYVCVLTSRKMTRLFGCFWHTSTSGSCRLCKELSTAPDQNSH